MGLNDSYNILRGQILMMKPLPTISTVYSMVIQEEWQRGIWSSSNFHPDVITMYASSDNTIMSPRNILCVLTAKQMNIVKHNATD